MSRIAAIAVVLALATACSSPKSPPAAAPVLPSDDAIRALLASRLEHNGVGIVVGVIEPGRRSVIASGRTGASDARPLDGDSIFQLGSLTKLFTTLLLADMVVREEVGLDDPISKYVPAGVTVPVRGRPITLRDLATHVSGLPPMPTNFSLRGEPDPYEAYSVDELYHFLSTYELPHQPGAPFEYSNFGVSLLGRLLADRAGKDYEALLRERVLAPLGLTSTAVRLTPDQTKRVIPGHDRYLRPVRTWELRTMPASGSLRSTANDMLAFLAAYLGQVETPLAAAIALQVGTPAQALGWIIEDGIPRHSGGKQGYRTAIAFDPKTHAGVIVLTNARTEDAPTAIAMHLLNGAPLPDAPRAPTPIPIVGVDPAVLDGYAGHYRDADGATFEIARRDDHLLLHLPGEGVSEFYPSSPRDFFLNTGNDEMTFVVDANGRTTGLTYFGDGRAAGTAEHATRL